MAYCFLFLVYLCSIFRVSHICAMEENIRSSLPKMERRNSFSKLKRALSLEKKKSFSEKLLLTQLKEFKKAVKEDDKIMVEQLLVGAEKDIDVKDEATGNTLLHFAVINNLPESAEVFIKNGACLNEFNGESLTPLHIASRDGLVAIVELLFNHEASPTVPGKKGNTPLHLALREYGKVKTNNSLANKYEEILRLFTAKHPGSLDVMNDNGYLPANYLFVDC